MRGRARRADFHLRLSEARISQHAPRSMDVRKRYYFSMRSARGERMPEGSALRAGAASRLIDNPLLATAAIIAHTERTSSIGKGVFARGRRVDINHRTTDR